MVPRISWLVHRPSKGSVLLFTTDLLSVVPGPRPESEKNSRNRDRGQESFELWVAILTRLSDSSIRRQKSLAYGGLRYRDGR